MQGQGGCDFKSDGVQKSPYREPKDLGQADCWVESLLGRGNSQCKVPEVVCACGRSSEEEARGAGTGPVREEGKKHHAGKGEVVL